MQAIIRMNSAPETPHQGNPPPHYRLWAYKYVNSGSLSKATVSYVGGSLGAGKLRGHAIIGMQGASEVEPWSMHRSGGSHEPGPIKLMRVNRGRRRVLKAAAKGRTNGLSTQKPKGANVVQSRSVA